MNTIACVHKNELARVCARTHERDQPLWEPWRQTPQSAPRRAPKRCGPVPRPRHACRGTRPGRGLCSRGSTWPPRFCLPAALVSAVASLWHRCSHRPPSNPRSPNPPGTITPSTFFSIFHASSCISALGSRLEASIHSMLIVRPHWIPEWCRDLTTLKYESCRPVYCRKSGGQCAARERESAGPWQPRP
jgi:hypothetical protein